MFGRVRPLRSAVRLELARRNLRFVDTVFLTPLLRFCLEMILAGENSLEIMPTAIGMRARARLGCFSCTYWKPLPCSFAEQPAAVARISALYLIDTLLSCRADFRYNSGTAATPNIDAWANRQGSIILQDFHSGGTVCSPTRATVLTGRNHFRDCVDFVFDCSDMTECVPSFEFAP